MTYDRNKHGWNRDWETDNIPDDMTEEVDMSNVHIEVCAMCDMPIGECSPGCPNISHPYEAEGDYVGIGRNGPTP